LIKPSNVVRDGSTSYVGAIGDLAVEVEQLDWSIFSTLTIWLEKMGESIGG